MKYHPMQSILIATGTLVSISCIARKDESKSVEVNPSSLKEVVNIIPAEFFSGNWKALGAVDTDGRPLILSVDMKKRKLQEHLPVKEIIKEVVPVDSGYALLLYVPKNPKIKKLGGLHTIIVLKKIGKNRIAMIQDPGLVSFYIRSE